MTDDIIIAKSTAVLQFSSNVVQVIRKLTARYQFMLPWIWLQKLRINIFFTSYTYLGMYKIHMDDLIAIRRNRFL